MEYDPSSEDEIFLAKYFQNLNDLPELPAATVHCEDLIEKCFEQQEITDLNGPYTDDSPIFDQDVDYLDEPFDLCTETFDLGGHNIEEYLTEDSLLSLNIRSSIESPIDFGLLDSYLHYQDITFDEYEQMEYENQLSQRDDCCSSSSLSNEFEEQPSPPSFVQEEDSSNQEYPQIESPPSIWRYPLIYLVESNGHLTYAAVNYYQNPAHDPYGQLNNFPLSSPDKLYIQYCCKCRKHGKNVLSRGKAHRVDCPYRDCQCKGCLSTEKMRKRRRIQQKKIKRFRKPVDPTNKKRPPFNCRTCKAHGITNLYTMDYKKHSCEFLNCTCRKCQKIKARRERIRRHHQTYKNKEDDFPSKF